MEKELKYNTTFNTVDDVRAYLRENNIKHTVRGLTQHYLFVDEKLEIRIREDQRYDNEGPLSTLYFITVKTTTDNPNEREECERLITEATFHRLLKSCTQYESVSKLRYTFTDVGGVWEVDCFRDLRFEFNKNSANYIHAEIEFKDQPPTELPLWVNSQITIKNSDIAKGAINGN